MWERLQRFNALPRPAKTLFLRAVLLLPLLAASLRLRGFQATKRWLQKYPGHPKETTSASASETIVKLTARMVLAADRFAPTHSTCLERSLVLWWLLGRQGIGSQLRIGVRKDGPRFAAHAWVEREGIAIGESETPHLHYAAFAEEMSGDAT
jgi:hypothetical protein